MGRADPGGVVQVLDRDRYAEERRKVAALDEAGLGLPGRGAGLIRRHGEERVELGIQRIDASEDVVDELRGADVAAADHRGLLERGGERELVGHGSPLAVPVR